ncbi:MAG: CBM9 family sugar-binding protein [Pseudoalteromonas sp.]|uniref:CBM9 family sugar-binding protein n=1 Tax=unclassified Pseudoalteromonas TaxID=194690 RepID=UPI003F96427A
MSIKLLAASLLFSSQVMAQQANYTDTPIVIDGVTDAAWQHADWHAMPHLMDGVLPSKTDFSGKYRLLWDENYLYLQAIIVDDVLIDSHANPIDKYWDDDALEIFIDSDASGGNHQYNHTAFAYHIGLDNQAADFGPDKKPHLYTDHLISNWKRDPKTPNNIIWEVAIKLYVDNYKQDGENTPLTITADKVIGFMLAYCDNDGSDVREHFMGSHKIEPVKGSRNLGFIDADVFGEVTLVSKKQD